MAGLKQCASSTDSDTSLFACTKQLVDAQLRLHTAAQLMSQVTSNPVPRAYLDCHSVSHVIGAETYIKYGTIEDALAQCSPGCFDGCAHGVLGEAVREKLGIQDSVDIAHMDVSQIRDIGSKYCAESSEICHGIGHILYSLISDFNKASDECSLISSGLHRDACVSGVVMQGVGGIGTSLILGKAVPDHISPPQGDLAYPCDTLPQKYQHGCFLYLPMYQDATFAKEGITNSFTKLQKGKETCESFKNPARSYCFEGMGRLATYFSQSLSNDADLADFCSGLSTPTDQKSCLLGREYIYMGYQNARDAFNICTSLESADLRGFCFNAIFSYSSSSMATAELACRYTDAKDLCFKENAAFQKIRTELPDYRFGLFGEEK